MKRALCIICAAIFFLAFRATVSFAGFSLPPEVYRMGSLKDVRAKAVSMNVPIVFVYSNENSSCGLARTATLDVVRELRDHALIVYVSRDDWASIPANVTKAMNSPAAGRFIPKTVVTNPGTDRVEMIIPYIGDRDRRISELQKVKKLTPK